MPKKKQRLSLSDELRQAVEQSEVSRYSIWQQTGIDQGTLSKFMAGDRGLSIESIDKLADLLGLHICTADAERSRPKGKCTRFSFRAKQVSENHIPMRCTCELTQCNRGLSQLGKQLWQGASPALYHTLLIHLH